MSGEAMYLNSKNVSFHMVQLKQINMLEFLVTFAAYTITPERAGVVALGSWKDFNNPTYINGKIARVHTEWS